jgi:hypothetical protein
MNRLKEIYLKILFGALRTEIQMTRFIIFLVLLVALLCRLDRHFLKKNHHFSIRAIQSTLTPQPKKITPTAVSLETLFCQPYTYLNKGLQSFVFISADRQFVIKFYRFPSHMRSFYWLTHPWPDAFRPDRAEVKQYNQEKLTKTLSSYTIADEELREESALVMTHLHQTEHIKKQLVLIDQMKQRYRIDLDQTCFIVQKTAKPIFPTLDNCIEQGNLEEAKRMIDSIILNIVERCHKGITDHDAILEKNYGWCDGRAIHVDVGRFAKEPTDAKTEVVKITESLNHWLRSRSPVLHEHYQQQVEQVE